MSMKSPSRSEQPPFWEEQEELLQSTAIDSVQQDASRQKRSRPYGNLQPQNLFGSEATKRVCITDVSQTSQQNEDSLVGHRN